jgi:hypothetical protein
MSLDLLDRPSLIASLPHGGIGAEIGVDVGGFSEVILERNQPRELWLVDCWHWQPRDQYGSDPANAVETAMEGKFQEVIRRFADRPHVHVMREWSVPAAAKFPDEYFDFVYLDANHLQVDLDIQAWWPKIRIGGALCGHDYCVVADYIDVKPKVDKWVEQEGLTLFVAGRNSPNIYEVNYPSWLVIKPERT